ncbi:MAG TPA: heme-binding domain-containing protein [Bacteroidia bacterium]|jgi:hypothetical protein|nr:heme-binding domain-containing protein [Bacteroidia bacterium]
MKKYFKLKNILLTFVSVFGIIQFIRPAKNLGEAFGPNDITYSVNVPENVKNILVVSCYDCHSNHTNHMWYENIQPIGWWIGKHISKGKRHLNFSEFNTYKDKRKSRKFEEIGETVSAKEMPMSSYTLIHGNAKLNDEQIKLVLNWTTAGHEKFKQEGDKD